MTLGNDLLGGPDGKGCSICGEPAKKGHKWCTLCIEDFAETNGTSWNKEGNTKEEPKGKGKGLMGCVSLCCFIFVALFFSIFIFNLVKNAF